MEPRLTKLNWSLAGITLLICLALGAFIHSRVVEEGRSSFPSSIPADAQNTATTGTPSDEVQISSTSQKEVGITVESAIVRNLYDTLSATGTVSEDPVGVAVLNGVLLVSHIAQLRQEGVSVDEAVSRGSQNRLRPVLMTAAIAIFSLIPMLYATGPGSEIQRPLATVVIGGLLTSTFLTLVVLPSLYSLFEPKEQADQSL
jgi:hypothetical protein